MAWTRFRNVWRNCYWGLLAAWYTRRFQQVGRAFQVKGLCRIRNAGRIELGPLCLLDSSWARPVRIDVAAGALLKLGTQVYLNEGVSITCHIRVTVGDRCLLGPDVVLLDDDGHPVDWRTRHEYQPSGPETRLGAPIVLEDDVWVGARAIILKGVTVGMGSVVAAGAVVTHSVPPRALVGGVPARVIREL